jgi:hypothetical protein
MDLGFDIKLKAKIAGGKRARWTTTVAHKGTRIDMLSESDGEVKKSGKDAATPILETGHGGSTAERAALRSHPDRRHGKLVDKSALDQWRWLAHARRRSSILVRRDVCWFGCWKKQLRSSGLSCVGWWRGIKLLS